MTANQRMKIANEKSSKNIHNRGLVSKVSIKLKGWRSFYKNSKFIYFLEKWKWRKSSCGSLASWFVHIRGVRFGCFSNNPKHSWFIKMQHAYKHASSVSNFTNSPLDKTVNISSLIFNIRYVFVFNKIFVVIFRIW